MQGYPLQNDGFRRPVVLEQSVTSQKMNLEYASVWRGECEDIHGKMKDFGGLWSGADRQLAENELRIGLTMERRMQGFPKGK